MRVSPISLRTKPHLPRTFSSFLDERFRNGFSRSKHKISIRDIEDRKEKKIKKLYNTMELIQVHFYSKNKIKCLTRQGRKTANIDIEEIQE